MQLLREKQNHLLDRKADIKNSINDIQTILSDNEKLGELIEKYSIVVKIPKNKSFVLRKENILPFNSNNAILQAELNDLQAELSNVDDQLFRIKQSLNSSPFKFDVKTVSDIALKNLKDANIDKSKVNTIVTEIGKDISKLKKQEISILRESENDYSIINECIRKRLLQITGKEFLDVDLIKADNSSFSGVELYNISLSYRLGILDFLENKLGIKLPFIIDSPGNGERVTNDVEKLFNSLLKENRQLIISTAESISEQTLKCFTNKIFAFGRIFENKYEQN